ncbi:MAG: MBL fold metallo-hydrolase [Myxococcales bacterium]|nr:MBL fold metallo-hydrolase [Myxococcales bacterium]
MAVQLQKAGLQLSGSSLWFDARRKTELSFVSHAHSDHLARHERIIATAPTIELMSQRLGKLPGALPAPYNRPFELGPLALELLPAGHILGSAQLRVTRADGHRVVYTGDISLQPPLTAEPAQLAECDTLVLESTFGHPRYVFPPRAEVLEEVEAWVRRQLERELAPILFCYALGKSQEVIKYLGDRGYRLCAHPATYDTCLVYRSLGVELSVRRFEGELRPGEVGVFPPFGRSAALKRIRPRATAVLTGWAVDRGAAGRYRADVAFPLSDHADHPALLEYARRSGASEVITHHGFARELAQALRALGISARAADQPVQLQLGL